MRIFILSCLAYAEGNEDLRNLSRTFSGGAPCEIVPWQNLDVGSLDEGSLILPLAAWDYSLDAAKFLSFLSKLEKSGAKIINGAEIVRWNLSKKYLLELEALGLPAIPSTLLNGDENIEELRRICPGGVIKPLVGQSGNGVAKIDEISNLSEYKKYFIDVDDIKVIALEKRNIAISKELEHLRAENAKLKQELKVMR